MADIRGVPGVVTGAYRVAALTGLTTGLAANAPIFSMRWGSSTQRCMIHSLKVQAVIVTPFTSAQEIVTDAIIARSFTVADSSGTAITLTGSNQVMWSSNHLASVVSDMRVSATATLTAGTRTLDANPILVALGNQALAAASAATNLMANGVDPVSNVRFSPILAQNEGIIARNVVAQGAAGTVRYAIEVEWLEFNPTAQ